MTYSDQEENKISERYIEKDGRGFRLICSDPHGFWVVHHAGNNQRVLALPGEYTSLNECIKAVEGLPEDKLPKPQTRKMVLTPKNKKKDVEED